MTVDLTGVTNTLLQVALATATACMPLLVAALAAKLHLDQKSAMVRKIVAAADAAAGLAYDYALKHEGGLASVSVRNAAVGAGLNYMLARVPDALSSMGINANSVSEMVEARLGKLLASDPTVTAGTPAAVSQAPGTSTTTTTATTSTTTADPATDSPAA